MRQEKFFIKIILQGSLRKPTLEITFEYDNDYIQKFPNQFITFSMPVSEKLYRKIGCSLFFEGLIPEGWLLK